MPSGTSTLPYQQHSVDGITSTALNTDPLPMSRADLAVKTISWQARLKTGTFAAQTVQLFGRVHPDADFAPIGSAISLVASNAWTAIQTVANTPVTEIRFTGASMGGGEEAEVRVLGVN